VFHLATLPVQDSTLISKPTEPAWPLALNSPNRLSGIFSRENAPNCAQGLLITETLNIRTDYASKHALSSPIKPFRTMSLSCVFRSALKDTMEITTQFYQREFVQLDVLWDITQTQWRMCV